MPYQAELATVGTQEGLKATAAQAADPERSFTNNLCWNHYNGCAGDIRVSAQAAAIRRRSASTAAWSCDVGGTILASAISPAPSRSYRWNSTPRGASEPQPTPARGGTSTYDGASPLLTLAFTRDLPHQVPKTEQDPDRTEAERHA